MKKFIMAAATLLVSAFSYAATPILTINGEQATQTPTSLAFDGDNVIVFFGEDSQSYDMESVSISFITTGVSDINFAKSTTLVGNKLMIDGARDGMATVYDAKGQRVASACVVNGSASVDLSSVAAGVYVLHTGNSVVKFVKR